MKLLKNPIVGQASGIFLAAVLVSVFLHPTVNTIRSVTKSATTALPSNKTRWSA